MSEELVVIQNGPLAPIENNAFEVDFGTIEKITPFLLSIDQPNTQLEGSQPGMLRLRETGLLRKAVKAVIIEQPKSSQRYELGEFPNKKLVCKSRDGVTPDKDAPSQQAMSCVGCKHNEASNSKGWERYRANPDKKNIPGCKITSRVIMIDYDRLAPIKMYVKGKSRREGLEQGMQQVIQQFLALRTLNGRVAWTDVVLTLTTKKIKDNANYELVIRDVHPLTPEEKKHLSGILEIIGKQKVELMAKVEAKSEQEAADAADDSVTAQVQKAASEGPVEGEYVEPKGGVEEI